MFSHEPAVMAEAIRQVLDDSRYKTGATALAAELMSLTPLDTALAEMMSFAG